MNWTDEKITALAKQFDGDGMPSDCSAVLSGAEIIAFARALLTPQATPAVPEGFAQGVEEAAKWVDQRRFDYESEHGYVDPDTSTLEFGTGQHAQIKEEYAAELAEIAEGIRGIDAAPIGYAVLPTVPTQAMLDAAYDASVRSYATSTPSLETVHRNVWDAMIAAAPSASAQEDKA